MNSAIRTFLPFDTDDLSVQALDEGRVAIVIGRALVNLRPGEAAALADSLSRAAIASGAPAGGALIAAPLPQIPAAPPVTDAMVDRAVDAFQQWWQDGSNQTFVGDGMTRALFTHVLREVLGGAA